MVRKNNFLKQYFLIKYKNNVIKLIKKENQIKIKKKKNF